MAWESTRNPGPGRCLSSVRNVEAEGNQFYIDPGATITAVEGGPIEAPGVTASQPTVVEGRSTANTPLAENTFTPVTTVTLPKGKWAVHANGSGVNFSDFDWAYCVVDTSAGSVSDDYSEAGHCYGNCHSAGT